jgi:hypothetical protein
LLDYPIEIHGSGWDHLDLTNKIGNVYSDVNYLVSEEHINNSLAQVNMSPNTSGGFHDRILRSYGAKTLCLSDYSHEESLIFRFSEQMRYQLNDDSIRESIEWALNNRSEVIELGKNISEKMENTFSVEASFQQMLEIAAAVREDQP